MRVTPEIIKAKKNKEKIIATTAYDYTFAKLLDSADVDLILVGDSVGMVCHGDKNTQSVTMDQMVYHAEGVSRGVRNALVVADMPINSYAEPNYAIENARRLIAAGAVAVKIEEIGDVISVVEALVNDGIPVVAHVGLTPQTAESFKVQGKQQEEAEKIIADACAFDAAGVFALVLECIPVELAKQITAAVSVPTIGIGAGRDCDGQILVCYDLLGMFQDFRPKFVRHFSEGGNDVKQALAKFRDQVNSGSFPSDTESFQ